MLAFILAITVALASLIFFLSAFFAPRLHRQDDFLWSGVGLFYALMLWVCAQRLTGGVLLGQLAAVILILGFAWQTLRLRWVIDEVDKVLEPQSFSLLDWLTGGKRPSVTEKPPAKKGFWGKKQASVTPVIATESSEETKVSGFPEETQATVAAEVSQGTEILEEMEILESEGMDNSDAITIIETTTRILEGEVAVKESAPTITTTPGSDLPQEEASDTTAEPI